MFGVTCLPVLWSPAGAPIAGVPGPRRSADECDAGWFAPVATRRRSMFGGLRPPSHRLAVLQTSASLYARGFLSPRLRLAVSARGDPPTTAARLYAAIYEDSAVAQSGRRSRSRLLAKLRPAGVLRQALAFAFACHGATAGVFPAASCVRDCSG